MSEPKPNNELFVIHFHGEILEPNVWRKYSKNYGGSGLYGWRAPKKIYYKLGHARSALTHLPLEVQKDCEIVRYHPGEVIERGTDSIEAYNKRQEDKKKRHLAQIKRDGERRIKALQDELARELERQSR